jgi:hypothetical protein
MLAGELGVMRILALVKYAIQKKEEIFYNYMKHKIRL